MNEAEYESSDGGEYLPDEDELEEDEFFTDDDLIPSSDFLTDIEMEDIDEDDEESIAVGNQVEKIDRRGYLKNIPRVCDNASQATAQSTAPELPGLEF